MPQTGVNETLEVLELIAVLAGAVRERATDADGFNPVSDGIALLADPAVRDAALNAIQGIRDIPAEMRDIDLNEVEELTGGAFGIVRALVGGETEEPAA